MPHSEHPLSRTSALGVQLQTVEEKRARFRELLINAALTPAGDPACEEVLEALNDFLGSSMEATLSELWKSIPKVQTENKSIPRQNKVEPVLCQLHRELHRIRRLKRNRAVDCYRFQRRVLSIITSAEKRIRRYREEIRAERQRLATASAARLSRAEAQRSKRRIARYHDSIEDARWSIATARSLADGLAFVVLPQWDIKPLSWKEPAGFLSGKEGLRPEWQVLRSVALKQKRVAILNDLTNCLRHGDLTLAASPPVLVEIKSGVGATDRDRRQHQRANEVAEYLRADVAHNWRGTGVTIERIEQIVPERHHRRVLPALISDARQCGLALRRVESGTYYIAVGTTDPGVALKQLSRRCPSELLRILCSATMCQVTTCRSL